ncbi:MAG: hypothetical protein OEV91_00935 [Desulfobulbaceae bacterium]|nr:hypothetical protein [Desulfobulbaceae bacterium]
MDFGGNFFQLTESIGLGVPEAPLEQCSHLQLMGVDFRDHLHERDVIIGNGAQFLADLFHLDDAESAHHHDDQQQNADDQGQTAADLHPVKKIHASASIEKKKNQNRNDNNTAAQGHPKRQGKTCFLLALPANAFIPRLACRIVPFFGNGAHLMTGPLRSLTGPVMGIATREGCPMTAGRSRKEVKQGQGLLGFHCDHHAIVTLRGGTGHCDRPTPPRSASPGLPRLDGVDRYLRHLLFKIDGGRKNRPGRDPWPSRRKTYRDKKNR